MSVLLKVLRWFRTGVNMLACVVAMIVATGYFFLATLRYGSGDVIGAFIDLILAIAVSGIAGYFIHDTKEAIRK